MKKFFNLSLAIIMAFCCLLTGCSFESTEEPSLDKFVAPASVMTSWGQTTIVDNGTEKYIEKEISASVYPARASQLVDYTVSWSENATLKSDDVSDYVVVLPESDGSLNAKVRCYKAFGDDIITITVKSRVNDVTSFCSVKYVGLATNIEIINGSVSYGKLSECKTSSLERGEYYSFTKNQSYYFDIKLSNVLDSVKSYELEFALSGFGNVHVGVYNGGFEPWYTDIQENFPLSNFSDFINERLLTFSSLDSNGLSWALFPEKSIEEAYLGDELLCVLCDRESSALYPASPEDLVLENQSLLDSCYFVLTVTEKLSGISTSIKFWVEPVPTNVSLNSEVLEF